MSLRLRHAVVLGGWVSAVVVAASTRAALQGGLPAGAELSLWLFLIVVPSILMLVMFREAPPQVVNEVIHSAEVRRQINILVSDAERDVR